MLEWKRVLAILCTFGLLREIRPSEPYVSEFILGPWRNITSPQLNKEIYPVGTYSYLLLLIGVFLVTDFMKYKPLILVSAFCGIVSYIILLWTETVLWLQIGQVIFGLYLATEVAYYTYIFAKVDEEHFKLVSSWSRAAALLGRFCSGTSAQLLYSFKIMDFRQLNYITLISQILCFFWAFFLPNVERSIYFHREVKKPVTDEALAEPTTKQLTGVALLWEHAKSAYSRPSVIAWSFIYACSMAGFLQVQLYMQLLWKEIEPNKINLYNGLVEAVQTVLGASAALLVGVKMPECCGFSNVSILLPILVSIAQAAATLMTSYAAVLWVSYIGYTILGILYHYVITFTSAEVARKLVYDSCYGLVFGINTLLALIIQSFLTTILISDRFLGLSIRAQYRAMSLYYMLLAVAVILGWIGSVIYKQKCKKDKKTMPDEETIESNPLNNFTDVKLSEINNSDY